MGGVLYGRAFPVATHPGLDSHDACISGAVAAPRRHPSSSHLVQWTKSIWLTGLMVNWIVGCAIDMQTEDVIGSGTGNGYLSMSYLCNLIS